MSKHYPSFSTPEDPLGQRFRVNFHQNKGIFKLPRSNRVPVDFGWLLQDLDRGWWGIFPASHDMLSYGNTEWFLTDAPIAIMMDASAEEQECE